MQFQKNSFKFQENILFCPIFPTNIYKSEKEKVLSVRKCIVLYLIFNRYINIWRKEKNSSVSENILFCPIHISSRHMNLKKKKVSGVIIFAICSADGPCFVLLPLRMDRIFEEILFLVEERQARYCLYYLFVGNIIFPRRPNLWRIIFLVAEILCLWINPNITFYEEELLLLKYWNTISPDKRSFTQLLVTLCNQFEYKTIKETKKQKEWMWKERKYLEDERWNTTSDR